MENKKTLCHRPFRELTLHHSGNIIPCCLLEDYILGNIKDVSLVQAWNGEKLRKLRREFLENKISICRDNIKTKSCHCHFPENKKNVDWVEVQEKNPQKLDIRLNGFCNLECIMCNVWRETNHAYDGSSFWTDGPHEIFPFLESIDLLGGEPFVQADTFKLIDLVSSINPDCRWNFTTNGNWKLQGKVLESLEKIKIDTIIVSVDAIFPDTYLKIRKGGDYRLMMQNIKSLKSYSECRSRPFDIKLDFVVQKENYKEVIPFRDFCQKKGLIPSFIFLTFPREFSLLEMKPEERLEIAGMLSAENGDGEFDSVIQNLKRSI